MKLRTANPTTTSNRYDVSCCPTCERPWLASVIPQKLLDDLACNHPVVHLTKSDGVELRKEDDLFIGECLFHRGAVLVIEEKGTRWSCSGGCPKGSTSVQWLMKTTGLDQRRTVEHMVRAAAAERRTQSTVMSLRTENPQLAAYVVTKGGLLKSVCSTETVDGVIVMFELDIIGLGEAWQLRKEFYACRWRVNKVEYSYQVGRMTERMFMAYPYEPEEVLPARAIKQSAS